MKISTAKLGIIIAVIALLSGCSVSQPTTSNQSSGTIPNPNEVTVGSTNTMQLIDYLRRVPGLQIDQNGDFVSIMIRGANSISGDNNPLFVINNQAVGNSYFDAVSAVDVNDIKSVNVIKGAEGQQLFGMRGSNGVIQIFTKKK